MVRGWHVALVLGLLLGLAAVPAARAENPSGDSGHQGDVKKDEGGKHDAGKEGELNIFYGALDLAIWTIVVFVVLFFVLRKFAWGPMLQGLQQRERSIHEAAEQAEQARNEARQLRDKLQAEMDKAAEKVREIMDTARKGAQHTTEEMIAKARAEIQSERDRLRREIDTARDQALQDLWNRSAQLAALISGKVVRRHLTVDDHRQLVDEALTDLGKAGTERRI